ncbi:MAG: sugar phosphate isomerase/epimerase [Lentisphaeraceae bacterium]|nr:sugar phosphate isomerase/epimerase [Lentisphaeraceae bacterium]
MNDFSLDRRQLLKYSLAGSLALQSCVSNKSRFKISLAEYSLHRQLYAFNPSANRYNIKPAKEKLDHLDFPKKARELGIGAVEYVNFFFPGMNFTEKYLAELNKRAADNGVANVLIMVGREGMLGDPNKKERLQAIENHKKWIHAAAKLGCHCIRVDAKGTGDSEEQIKNIGESLHILADYADTFNLDITVENHGGLSSNGDWLVKCIKVADHKRIGTLPDFGNFYDDDLKKFFDPYKGTETLLPYAKALSAKTYEVIPGSEHIMVHPDKGYKLDFKRLMQLTVASNYSGYIGIEYEGGEGISEPEGILMTKRLIEKYISEFT